MKLASSIPPSPIKNRNPLSWLFRTLMEPRPRRSFRRGDIHTPRSTRRGLLTGSALPSCMVSSIPSVHHSRRSTSSTSRLNFNRRFPLASRDALFVPLRDLGTNWIMLPNNPEGQSPVQYPQLSCQMRRVSRKRRPCCRLKYQLQVPRPGRRLRLRLQDPIVPNPPPSRSLWAWTVGRSSGSDPSTQIDRFSRSSPMWSEQICILMPHQASPQPRSR